MTGWNDELMQWLEPFLMRLGHKRRRQMCPLYVAGLIGPGERKSIEPIAARLAPDRYDRLHHFISSGVWDADPLEEELARQADRMVGGSRCGSGRRRYGVAEEGHPFGRGGAAICFRARQDEPTARRWCR